LGAKPGRGERDRDHHQDHNSPKMMLASRAPIRSGDFGMARRLAARMVGSTLNSVSSVNHV